MRNVSARENQPTREKALAWGDFHARSRFARSTIPEEESGLIVVYVLGLLQIRQKRVVFNKLQTAVIFFITSSEA